MGRAREFFFFCLLPFDRDTSLSLSLSPAALLSLTFDLLDLFLKKKKNLPVQANATRFVFDGARIDEAQTPASLGLEDGDQIDAMVEQLGGGGKGSAEEA